jgi:O-antigen/teichoic acid export membrane protein
MSISVFTSRVVLQALGVENYGIYNVVGGFVAMFSILSSSLVNASQRFISYEMGKPNPQMSRLFCGTVSVHLLLALFVLIVFESFGLWFLNTQLNIAPDRLTAANWVFQCSVITFCVKLISVPYHASIIAHERMDAFAYIGIYEVLAKLGIVYLLWLSNYDKLIVYALLMLVVSVSLRIIYGIYCKRNFDECRFHFVIDRPLFKDMLSFSGWNFIGSTVSILSTQGINILTNIFFGVALNAARGLAQQVDTAIYSFITNFMTAMNPQITKSFAAKNYEYTNNLMFRGAKYSTILFLFLSLPVFIKTDYILDLWLVEVPPYAVVFLRLAIIYSLFQSMSYTLYIGMLATGNIKKYQIVMGTLYMGTFPLCYLFFKIGLGPEWGYISAILILFLGVFVRLYLLRQIIPSFSIMSFLKGTIFKVLYVLSPSFIIVTLASSVQMGSDFLSLLFTVLVSVVIIPLSTYMLALEDGERIMIKEQMMKFYKTRFARESCLRN